MNSSNDISDEEFVPFLNSLGVDTCKKSFEWMLNDPEFAGVLRWLYDNLDHNNALTAREECRFAELEKSGQLLSAEELKSTVCSIQDKYPGICLPGDNESLEDVKFDISMQMEKLSFLERQERTLKDLIKQKEIVKDELTVDLTRLSTAQQQLAQDEAAAAEECLGLAGEVETDTESVVDVVTDTLELYGNCHVNKDIAKNFLTFGPLESYRQTQAMFKSHFDLNTFRKFGTNKADDFTEQECRTVLAEAKRLEDRLSDAVYTYIESKVELSGEQAKLILVGNFSNVHPSQVTVHTIETRTALELLSQEESILYQQLETAVKGLVASRTKLVVDTTTRAMLDARERLHADLSHFLETSQQALAVDRVLYCALRHELRAVEQFVEFAGQLREYVEGEGDAVASRIDAMNDICGEQDACEQSLQSSDVLTHSLCGVLGVPHTTEPAQLVRVHSELLTKIQELNVDIRDRFMKREDALIAFKQSTQPLRKYIWDGSTNKPNCWDRTVAALMHSLKQEVDLVEKKVVENGSLFTSVKNGDKQNLRKLWQWFLTEPQRLMAAVKGITTPGS